MGSDEQTIWLWTILLKEGIMTPRRTLLPRHPELLRLRLRVDLGRGRHFPLLGGHGRVLSGQREHPPAQGSSRQDKFELQHLASCFL